MSRALDTLRPELRGLVDPFLADCAAAGFDIVVTCAYRSDIEQDALYTKGRTAPGMIVTHARAGQSAHNFGLAIDIVPIIAGKPDWNGTDPTWLEIANLGQARGLRWLGAPDSPFIEQAHFEHPQWKQLAGVTT